MIELTMQVSDFDYTETLDNFLPDLIRILSEGDDVNPLIRKAVGASPELSKKIVKGILAAMSQKQKEALISYVGKGRELIVDTGELDFPAGSDDVLILCSDGVYKTASEKTLCKILKETTEFEKVPAAVTDAAMAGGQSGKHDNISLIAIKRN